MRVPAHLKGMTMQQSTLTPAPTPAGAITNYTFNRGNDRCDRCGAEAYVATEHGLGSILLWCGHHFNKHKAALETDPMVRVVANETDRLTLRETEVH